MNFNSVINHILPSASMKIGLNSNDSELTNFAIGAPDIAPPDKLLELLRNRATESNYSYTPTMGSSQGRKNIANILSDSEQELSPDNLLLCEGAKYGIYLTLKAVCQRQSKVLVVEPYWLSYPQIIASLDLQMVIYSPESIENGRLQYNFNELINRAISEKVSAVIINNPNNPSRAGVTTYSIDSRSLVNKGTQGFNERSLLISLLNQLAAEDNVNIFPVDFQLLNEIKTNYGTSKVMFSLVEHDYSPNITGMGVFSSLLLYPILFVYVPVGILTGNNTQMNVLILDLENGVIENGINYYFKDSPKKLQLGAHMYDIFKKLNTEPIN